MKIGIDIRTASGKKTGKGWYTFNLIKWILALDRKNEYVLYTDAISGDVVSMLSPLARAANNECQTANGGHRMAHAEYGNQNPHIKLIHAHKALWHFAVIKDFLRQKGDLFFAPTSYIIPAFLPKSIKSVITVHDLVSFIHPHLHESKATILEHLFFRKALKKAHCVLTPSNNTKKDLARMFHYPSEKIAVTHLGVDEIFFKKPDPQDLAKIKQKYNLPEKFILTVGGLEPRKNIEKLVDAFLKISAQHQQLKLVIVGGKGWKSKNLQSKIAGLKDKILHIENCKNGDLRFFYRLADIFVFPSIYEGFGLPPLEAMASGCPVICSFAASLAEVCGSAAFYIDPKNPKNLEDALNKVFNDAGLREKLKTRGGDQAQKFSWRKTAEKTIKTIDHVKVQISKVKAQSQQKE